MFNQPPQGQQPQNNDTDSNMQLSQSSQFYGNMIHSQQPVPQPGAIYAPFVTDTNGYRFPLSIYPITKAYASKEMQGMERNLVTKTDWTSNGYYIVQKAVEEVNEKDRFASSAGSSKVTRSGGGGYGDGGFDAGSGVKEESCWEMCGLRYDGNPEWDQIAVLLEKVVEEGGENNS